MLCTLTAAISPLASAGDFYDPPALLPAENGALIRQEPLWLATAAFAGHAYAMSGVGTRIMYRSTDALGRPVAITGAYIEPNTPWRGPGPRPLVSFAVATQGVGDSCAASKTLASWGSLSDGKAALNYEIPSIDSLLTQGIAVVVTDYLGLGTTDRLHTYIVKADLGHAVLDAARAALALPGTSVNGSSPIGLYGYSQGGSAAGAAAELAASYAPELNVRAAYIGNPASNLVEVLRSIDGSSLAGIIAWEINGLFTYYPELQGQLDAVTNALGKKWLAESHDQCLVDVIYLDGFQRTAKFTQSGKSLVESIQSYPDILAIIEAQRLGAERPRFPVLVLSGTQDDLVGHHQARQLAKDWCQLGGDVTYRALEQKLPASVIGVNHMLPALTEYKDAHAWLVKRLQGEPGQANCDSMDGPGNEA